MGKAVLFALSTTWMLAWELFWWICCLHLSSSSSSSPFSASKSDFLEGYFDTPFFTFFLGYLTFPSGCFKLLTQEWTRDYFSVGLFFYLGKPLFNVAVKTASLREVNLNLIFFSRNDHVHIEDLHVNTLFSTYTSRTHGPQKTVKFGTWLFRW